MLLGLIDKPLTFSYFYVEGGEGRKDPGQSWSVRIGVTEKSR